MKIVGVHHVALQVADVTAARTFYRDVMGLPEIERPDFPIGGAWFQLGSPGAPHRGGGRPSGP